MTAHETARTPRRAFWSDARFLLGILLIVASVAGVWFVVSAARQTTPAFAAARTIVPGEAITADDVREVDVALGQLGTAYLTPAQLDGAVIATRTIAEGELVPSAAVGDAAGARTTNVVVHSTVEVPSSVGAGTVVEVWAAPLHDGEYAKPRILVADATVVSVVRDDSVMGGGASAVELVIPRADVAATLEAMADESALSVVPTVGAGS